MSEETGLPILLSFSNGATAARLDRSASDEEVKKSPCRRCARCSATTFPSPKACSIPRWLSDPWSRGGYSYPGLGSTPEDRETYARPLGNRVFFAGEATEPVEYGTVHAALWSGEQTAEALFRDGYRHAQPWQARHAAVGQGALSRAVLAQWSAQCGLWRAASSGDCLLSFLSIFHNNRRLGEGLKEDDPRQQDLLRAGSGVGPSRRSACCSPASSAWAADRTDSIERAPPQQPADVVARAPPAPDARLHPAVVDLRPGARTMAVTSDAHLYAGRRRRAKPRSVAASGWPSTTPGSRPMARSTRPTRCSALRAPRSSGRGRTIRGSAMSTPCSSASRTTCSTSAPISAPSKARPSVASRRCASCHRRPIGWSARSMR